MRRRVNCWLQVVWEDTLTLDAAGFQNAIDHGQKADSAYKKFTGGGWKYTTPVITMGVGPDKQQQLPLLNLKYPGQKNYAGRTGKGDVVPKVQVLACPVAGGGVVGFGPVLLCRHP